MLNQSSYIMQRDSSVLVGLPILKVTYKLTKKSKHGYERFGEVFIKAADLTNTPDVSYNDIVLEPIEWALEHAHYAICDVLGLDARDYDGERGIDGLNAIKEYEIVSITTVLCYESHADGSSA